MKSTEKLPHRSAPERVQAESRATTRADVLAAMQQAALPGQETLDAATLQRLRILTAALLSGNRSHAEAEYGRFVGMQQRGLRLETQQLRQHLAGKTLLVTGGTGCIGSVLLAELVRFNPARVVSVSRGATAPWQAIDAVEYAHADLRNKSAVEHIFQDVRPDIVFHLAAQHDPGLAEAAVAHTLSTNITGTRNTIEAAKNCGAAQIVFASTGKAARLFTPDTYAASKKAGEWLMAVAAVQGDVRCSAARFTHVVDNSIILKRLKNWIATAAPIRLHDPDVYFYMQSAREAAHLLLNAGLEAEAGVFSLQAVRDLEWPVNLVDLALGAMAKADSAAPIYFCGFESGYEENPYPGLYDLAVSGEVSPLINAFEAPQTRPSTTCPVVDRFPLAVTADAALSEQFQTLEQACTEDAPDSVLHAAKNALSWALLDSRLQAMPPAVLQTTAQRVQRLCERQKMSDDHLRTNAAIDHGLQQQGLRAWGRHQAAADLRL